MYTISNLLTYTTRYFNMELEDIYLNPNVITIATFRNLQELPINGCQAIRIQVPFKSVHKQPICVKGIAYFSVSLLRMVLGSV